MQTFPQHIFNESSKCQKLIISCAFAVCQVCGNGHVSVSASVKQRSACYSSPSSLRLCEYAYPVENFCRPEKVVEVLTRFFN